MSVSFSIPVVFMLWRIFLSIFLGVAVRWKQVRTEREPLDIAP